MSKEILVDGQVKGAYLSFMEGKKRVKERKSLIEANQLEMLLILWSRYFLMGHKQVLKIIDAHCAFRLKCYQRLS